MAQYPRTVPKDPLSDEIQGENWTRYLAELGPTILISSSTWTITGPDAALTKHNEGILPGNLKTVLYLAGGTLGSTYVVRNQIITNSAPPQIDIRSFGVIIENR